MIISDIIPRLFDEYLSMGYTTLEIYEMIINRVNEQVEKHKHQ